MHPLSTPALSQVNRRPWSAKVLRRLGECLRDERAPHLHDEWANAYETLSDWLGRGIRYGEVPRDPARARLVDDLQRLSLVDGSALEVARDRGEPGGGSASRREAPLGWPTRSSDGRGPPVETQHRGRPDGINRLENDAELAYHHKLKELSSVYTDAKDREAGQWQAS